MVRSEYDGADQPSVGCFFGSAYGAGLIFVVMVVCWIDRQAVGRSFSIGGRFVLGGRFGLYRLSGELLDGLAGRWLWFRDWRFVVVCCLAGRLFVGLSDWPLVVVSRSAVRFALFVGCQVVCWFV